MIKEEIMSKKIDVLSLKGEKVKDIKLEDNIFNIEPNDAVIKDAVVVAMAGARQGTAKVKTRSEVAGGGRKPYRQKGTGNARQGSIRAPHYRHGGIVCYDHLGEKYYSVTSMCEHWGIARKLYEYRISHGWSQEKSLTTPPRCQIKPARD